MADVPDKTIHIYIPTKPAQKSISISFELFMFVFKSPHYFAAGE